MVYQISFEEIVQGRDSIVRVTDDSLLYAVDLAMVVTGKTAKEACRNLRGIPEHAFSKTKYVKRMISTRGGYATKLVSFKHAIELVMVLNGEVARIIRLSFVKIIQRYMQGDESMHDELHLNKERGAFEAAKSIFNESISKKKKSRIVPKTKYIYVFASEAFKEEVKIGRASDVKARLSSGNTMCAPKPHKIVAIAPTLDAERDETMAHAYFAPFRTKGEFFKISHEDASAFLANHIATRYFQEINELMQCMKGSTYPL